MSNQPPFVTQQDTFNINGTVSQCRFFGLSFEYRTIRINKRLKEITSYLIRNEKIRGNKKNGVLAKKKSEQEE